MSNSLTVLPHEDQQFVQSLLGGVLVWAHQEEALRKPLGAGLFQVTAYQLMLERGEFRWPCAMTLNVCIYERKLILILR